MEGWMYNKKVKGCGEEGSGEEGKGEKGEDR